MTILMRPHNDKDEVAKASRKRNLKRTHPAKEEKKGGPRRRKKTEAGSPD